MATSLGHLTENFEVETRQADVRQAELAVSLKEMRQDMQDNMQKVFGLLNESGAAASQPQPESPTVTQPSWPTSWPTVAYAEAQASLAPTQPSWPTSWPTVAYAEAQASLAPRVPEPEPEPEPGTPKRLSLSL